MACLSGLCQIIVDIDEKPGITLTNPSENCSGRSRFVSIEASGISVVVKEGLKKAAQCSVVRLKLGSLIVV